MAKFKKPILLQEEFAAGEVSSNTTTPAVKTTSDTVGTEQVAANKSGEQVRAEIVQDVDTILTNLEQLSKQITEDIDIMLEEFEKTCDVIINEEYQPINEDFMAEVMKQVQSMKAYGKLKGGYAKYKKNVLKAELKKEEQLGEFEFTKDEKKEKLVQGIKDKFQKAIDKVNANPKASAVKKKADRDRIRGERDKVIKDGGGSIDIKLGQAKDKLTKKLDAKIRDMNTKLSELQGDNKIESELMSKQWAGEKLAIDDAHEIDVIEKKGEIQLKFQKDNPEFQERMAKKIKAQQAKIKKETAERKAELEKDLQDAQKQLEAEATSGSEKEQAAKAKISAFLKAGNTYINFLNGADFEAMEDEEGGKDLRNQKKELAKAYNDANGAVSVKVFQDASEGTSEEDAEEQYTSFTKSVSEAIEEFKDKLDAIDFDEEEKDQTKSAQDVALEALGDTIGDYTKITNPEEQVTTTDGEGNETSKNKWTDVKRFKGKDKEGKDTDEEVIYAKRNDSQSAGTANGTDLEEGNEFGAARAEAIAKGEKTFKVGDEEYPVEDVSKEDEENAEEYAEEEGIATEAKEELPKKIKLYEGMSVADRFKALM